MCLSIGAPARVHMPRASGYFLTGRSAIPPADVPAGKEGKSNNRSRCGLFQETGRLRLARKGIAFLPWRHSTADRPFYSQPPEVSNGTSSLRPDRHNRKP